MINPEDTEILRGSEIIEDRGIDDEGVKVRCNRCDGIQTLTPDNAAGAYTDRWVCQNCWNNWLIRFNGKVDQPVEFLTVSSAIRESEPLHVGEKEFRVYSETSDELTKEHFAAYLLNREAKDGQYGIGTYNIGYHYPVIVLDGLQAVGYLLWGPSSNDHIVLRQMYFFEEYRRQGIGSELLDYWWHHIGSEWVDEHRDDEEPFYHVESPNSGMVEVIRSANHDGEDGRPAAYEYSIQ